MKNVNRAARGKGAKAERELLNGLVNKGYEVRRTHLSLFPDIIAWNENEMLMIEVKQRASHKGGINALSMFRSSVKSVKMWNKDARILCYLSINGTWKAVEWINGVTEEVESIM